MILQNNEINFWNIYSLEDLHAVFVVQLEEVRDVICEWVIPKCCHCHQPHCHRHQFCHRHRHDEHQSELG